MNYKEFLDYELYSIYLHIVKAQAGFATISDCITALGLNKYNKNNNLLEMEREKIQSKLDSLQAIAEDYKLI